MRVDENWQARVCMSVSSTLIARFPCFLSLLPRFFSSFCDACQTADCPSHYSNCHLSMIRNNIYIFFSLLLLLWVMTWTSLASVFSWVSDKRSETSAILLSLSNSPRRSCNCHDRSNEPNLSLTHIKIWTSSKLMTVHERAWEGMRVDESWRSNETESCDSHSCLIRIWDLKSFWDRKNN